MSTKYQRIVIYLYELEQYKKLCFTEIKPTDKVKITAEIERCKQWLYTYPEEEADHKQEVFHGFVVDKRMDLIHKSRLMKKKKEYEALGYVKDLD